jgi:antitoxin component YwqK of YwqJK toxin-antitoxin module
LINRNLISICFFSFVISQDVLQLNQIQIIKDIYYNKIDQSIVNGKIYFKNNGNNIYLGYIIEGKKNGKWLEVYSNGNRKGQFVYKNGLLNGAYTIWYKNNVKGEYGFYKNDKKDRLIIKWDQQGKKYSSATFKDGFYHGKIIFYEPSEEVKYEGIYHEGKCIEGIKKGFRHRGRFINPVYEEYKNSELIKLKWLDKEDKVFQITDCLNNNCN